MIYLLIIGICYWWIRSLYFRHLNLKLKYDLFRLRDKLRFLAVEKKIHPHNWAFEYLDITLCKSVERMERMNLLLVLILSNRVRRDLNYVRLKSKLGAELKKNEHAQELYEEFGIIVFDYLLKKHYLISLIIWALNRIAIFNSFTQKQMSSLKKQTSSLRIYPISNHSEGVMSFG